MPRKEKTKGQKAAIKAWITRRENAEKEKRSERAKKAWETRRKNERLGI